MQPSTPLLLAKTLLGDVVFNPKLIKKLLTQYINERSFSYPLGNIPTASIFDFVPDADKRTIKFQSIFEIPNYPCGSQFESQFYTASASFADSYSLALMSQKFAKKTIIEVGTSYGESALTLALNSPVDCTVHTLDIQKDNPTIGIKWRNHELSDKIRQHWKGLAEIEHLFAPRSVDMIFIDGDHSYRGVVTDTTVALRLIRPGGLICWHDYSFRFRDSVVKAIDEVRAKTDIEIRKIVHTNLTAATINT